MKFLRRKVLRNGALPVRMLTPQHIPSSVTGLELCLGDDYWILGDSDGQAFLAELFLCAASLEQGEFIYVPTTFVPNAELQAIFPGQTNTFLDLVVLNYCALTLSGKQVQACLASTPGKENTVERTPPPGCHCNDAPWKVSRRLTAKRCKNHLVLCANRDIYHTLAWAAGQMTDIPDEDASNTYAEHFHFDREETTSKSPGVMLRYWYNTPEAE